MREARTRGRAGAGAQAVSDTTLVPHVFRRDFAPAEGQRLVVELNLELVETVVLVKPVGPNGVIAMIVSTPTRKGSGFSRGQQIAVRRSTNALGQEVWTGISEAALTAAVERERAPRRVVGEIG
jgi:hypothetical protein